MTISIASPSSTPSPFFILAMHPGATTMNIKMSSLTNICHTKYLPNTLEILQKRLPGIFLSKCFNDGHLSFEEEVKDTEVGHLFEHILLEYLCQTKVNCGALEAIYTGETMWNWQKDPRGSFHIHLDVAFKDTYVFQHALKKSVALLNTIFETRSATN